MTIQEIKQQLFAYRNGVVADTLRKCGDPHSTIFGLLLPQLSHIAVQVGSDRDIATELWQNKTSRECRLLAAMVYPREEFTQALGQAWLADSLCNEEIDVLCLKLISRTPWAESLSVELLTRSDDEKSLYSALRIILNLLSQNKLDATSELISGVMEIDTERYSTLKPLIMQIKHYND